MNKSDLAWPADAAHAYVDGQLRSGQASLLQAFSAESALSVAGWDPRIDVPYGQHPRAVFDFYRSPLPWHGTLVFLHAGYWQARDKAQFRFLAPPFLTVGVDVVLMNYPLCPDVTLRQLVAAVRGGIPKVLAYLAELGRGGRTLVVAGHSAGGHLATELALTDWPAGGIAEFPIAGIVPVSGVYELAPLLATRLNDKLRLDENEARAMSPLHRVRAPLPRAAFIVGGAETPEFRAQSQVMHETWLGAGGASALTEVAEADHFSVLREFKAGSAVFKKVMDLFGPS